MTFDSIVVGPLGVNCFIVGCEETGQGIVVDPGDDTDNIMDVIAQRSLQITAIINTHGHFDHIGGNHRIRGAINAPLMIHPADEAMLSLVAVVATRYGMTGTNSPPADKHLADGMVISFGSSSLEVIHTPGHTPGGCCLYFAKEKKIITGDTLFADGIGRTDLPGGSYDQLAASIRNRLFTLPDEVVAYPGHGPSTTIGHEKRHNPYLE